MADSVQLPVAEGGRASGGGKPNMLLIGAVGVGGVALIYLMLKGGSGSKTQTTSAQTSINAALGSVEEQQLNLMGQLGQVGATLGTQIGGVSSEVAAGNAALTDQLGNVNANVIVGNQQSLDSLQATFKNYAQQQFGYNANLGGGAGYLALPQNWTDFMHFLMNPSLANPDYQKVLITDRGYVFQSQANVGAPSSTGLGTLAGA